MSAIAGVIGLAIGAGGAVAILWPKLKSAEAAQQQLSQDLQRQDKRLTDELNDQGRRHHETVSALEAQLSQLQATLATAQSDLSALEAQKQALETEVSDLQTALATAQADHQAIVRNLEAQISQQRQQVLALQQCTHNLEQRLAKTLTADTPGKQPSAAIVEPQSLPIAQAEPAAEEIIPSTAGIALTDILQQARDRDEHTRANTALVLGAIASTSALSQVVPILRTLTELGRDPSATVRLAVVEAVSDWRSPKVLPLLRQALRDPDPAVVKAANAGLTPFRGALRKAQVTKKKSRSQRRLGR